MNHFKHLLLFSILCSTVSLTNCRNSGDLIIDSDSDGIMDMDDICIDTPIGEIADNTGCSNSQKDTDEDGITDDLDTCIDTPENTQVNTNGCAQDSVFVDNTYSNPITELSLPDPTIIKADNGNFYLYATENIRNAPILESTDLVNWELLGTAFTEQNRPSFLPDGSIWAPDINFINGQYVLYYALAIWGDEWTCGIGAATSDNPTGPFSDKGKLFQSNEIDVQNSIDPFYIEEDGKKYLFWGSFRGIYGHELSEDGLSLKQNAEKFQIAGTAYEATYIYKRGQYYYLFCAWGSCCEGANSTYQTVVGRSESLFGPFLNKNGESMSDNEHEIMIHGNDHFVGTGHNTEIISDNEGKTWMLYHAFDLEDPTARVLMLDEIQWENNWPFVEGNSPNLSWIKPSL